MHRGPSLLDLAAVQADTAAAAHLQKTAPEAILVGPELVSVEVGPDHVQHCPALLVADAVKEVLDDPCRVNPCGQQCGMSMEAVLRVSMPVRRQWTGQSCEDPKQVIGPLCQKNIKAPTLGAAEQLKLWGQVPLLTATESGLSVTCGAEASQVVTCCRRSTQP